MHAEVNLLTPIKLQRFELPNRIVMAPLTRLRASALGVQGQMNATYYSQRASAGLIITECTMVSPQSHGYENCPGIYSSEQVAGWRLVTDAVHASGGKIFLQLWHCGRRSHPLLQPHGQLPVAPSAIAAPGDIRTPTGKQPMPIPHALLTQEIPGIVEQFSLAARNAMIAGFDGIELHAANGYLLEQFLRDGSNQRTDRYGGSLQNRARFLLEVLEAVLDVWGSERVGVKLSPGNNSKGMNDSNPAALFGYAISALNDYDLAYLHLTEPVDISELDFKVDQDLLKLTTSYFRLVFKGTLMTNGGYNREKGNAALAASDADLVSFARLFLANPDLPERFKANANLNTPDPQTFYVGGEKGYIDYPVVGSSYFCQQVEPAG